MMSIFAIMRHSTCKAFSLIYITVEIEVMLKTVISGTVTSYTFLQRAAHWPTLKELNGSKHKMMCQPTLRNRVDFKSYNTVTSSSVRIYLYQEQSGSPQVMLMVLFCVVAHRSVLF